jgi:phosphorylcholine metabolism protein LicD
MQFRDSFQAKYKDFFKYKQNRVEMGQQKGYESTHHQQVLFPLFLTARRDSSTACSSWVRRILIDIFLFILHVISDMKTD